MTAPRRESDDDAATVGSPEQFFRDGSRIAPASRGAQAVENPLVSLQSLEAKLQEMTLPFSKVQGENTSDSIADRPMFERRQL